MSQQLTLSSLFCVLALGGLCMVTGLHDLAGIEAPVAIAATYQASASSAKSLM